MTFYIRRELAKMGVHSVELYKARFELDGIIFQSGGVPPSEGGWMGAVAQLMRIVAYERPALLLNPRSIFVEVES